MAAAVSDQDGYDEVNDLGNSRPHVVLLGAGASCQALPDGDLHGRRLPALWNMVEILNLGSSLLDAGVVHKDRNFEAIYSQLAASGDHPELLQELESAVFEYFAGLALPDEPNLYDHLLLSLRRKDVVATFNWDPFLTQAYRRCGSLASMPRLLFLHGNVAIGFCDKHRPISMGNRGSLCRKCREPLVNSRLLYPVEEKNYQNDISVSAAWSELQSDLGAANILTVFGYSAPDTDIEAKSLLQQGWGDSAYREQEQTEIIDIRDEDDLQSTWDPFIHTHHCEFHRSFYDSFLARHPRRSCEAMRAQNLDIEYLEDRPIPRAGDFDELRTWCRPLVEAEALLEHEM